MAGTAGPADFDGVRGTGGAEDQCAAGLGPVAFAGMNFVERTESAIGVDQAGGRSDGAGIGLGTLEDDAESGFGKFVEIEFGARAVLAGGEVGA